MVVMQYGILSKKMDRSIAARALRRDKWERGPDRSTLGPVSLGEGGVCQFLCQFVCRNRRYQETTDSEFVGITNHPAMVSSA